MSTRSQRALIALIALSIAGALALKQALQPERWRGRIAAQLAQWTGGEVALGGLAWGLDGGLWLRVDDLSIADTRLPLTDIAFATARARLSLRPLLQGVLAIDELQLAGPRITYRLAAPAATPDAAPQQTPSAGLPLDIALRSLHIHDGTLTLIDARLAPAAARTTRLDAVDIRLADLAAGASARLDATARLNTQGQLALTGRLAGLQRHLALDQPWLTLQLSAQGIPLDGLDAYLGDASLAAALSGQVSARASYDGDLADNGTLQALLQLGQLRYRDARLSATALPGQPLDLALDARLAGAGVQVERLRLQSGGLQIDASATIDSWRRRPRLVGTSASGVIPLHELQALLPWRALGSSADYLRDLTASGGVLRLEQLNLPDFSLRDAPDWRALLPQVAARISASGLSVRATPELPRIDQLQGSVELQRGVATGRDITARLGPLRLPALQFEARELTRAPVITATARGRLALAAGGGAEVAALLRRYGLARFTIDGDVDASAEVALREPRRWRARGAIRVDDAALTTQQGDRLSAGGTIRLRRREHLDLLLDGIAGRINGAPFKVAGAVLAADTPSRLADLELGCQNLALAPLAHWLPALAPLALSGSVSGDVRLYLPADAPARARALGQLAVTAVQLRLADAGLQLSNATGAATLGSRRVDVPRLSARVNDQPIELRGSLQYREAPALTLQLSSTSLDIDRLLPPTAPDPRPAGAAPSTAANRAAPPPTLPSWAQRGSATIDVTVDRGSFRQVRFSDVAVRARYQHSQLERATLDLRLPRGRVRASGSADLSKLDAIEFALQHDIAGVELAEFTRLLKGGTERASGIVHSQGEFSGNTADLKGTARGRVTASAGPGQIPDRSVYARTLFNVLSVINVQGILKGEIGTGLAIEGMPYDSLLVDAAFAPEHIAINQLDLITPAFGTRVIGEVGNGQLALDGVITVLGTLDRIIELVPLIGAPVSGLTKVYLRIGGTPQAPTVRVQPAKGLRSGVSDILRLPLRIIPQSGPE